MKHPISQHLVALGIAVASQAIAFAADATAPEWIPVFPAGTFKGADGRGPYTVEDPAALIAASQTAGRPIPVDYNHQTVFACLNGGDSPAAGWIDRFEVREGGLIWAHVDWTPDGGKAVASKEYRFTSPVFKHSPDGIVRRLESVALTNNPNLVDLPAINSKIGEHMDEFMKQLRAALGLPEAADQAAIIKASQAATTSIAAHSAAVTGIAAMVGLSGAPTPLEVAAAVKTKIATGAPDPAKFVPMAAFAELQTEVATLKGIAATQSAANAVEAAMTAGKVSPAMKDWATSYAAKDPAGFEAWAKASPAIVKPGGHIPDAQRDPNAALDANETEVCSKLGLSVEDYRKSKVAA